MTKNRSLFSPIFAIIALLLLASTPICGVEINAEERERKECENFKKSIIKGTLNVNRAEAYLRKKLHDSANPEIWLDALQGGKFSWENFWCLSPRAFFAIVWSFFLNPFSSIAPAFIGFFRYIPMLILKPFLYLIVSNVIKEDDLAQKTFTDFPLTYWLNHGIFKFIAFVYIIRMLFMQCRTANLFMLASYTNAYTRPNQITLLKAIAAIMKENDIAFNQNKGMIIRHTAEDYGTVAEENISRQEKELNKLYGTDWLFAFIQVYFIYGLLRFTHKSAGLEIYWGNELFYLRIKGEGELDEIIAYVEKEAPDSKESKGYVHKDQHDIPPLSVFFNDQEKQGSTYWALANDAFRAQLPFIDAEYQNPGEELF